MFPTTFLPDAYFVNPVGSGLPKRTFDPNVLFGRPDPTFFLVLRGLREKGRFAMARNVGGNGTLTLVCKFLK